jgi:hypothetical protein
MLAQVFISETEGPIVARLNKCAARCKPNTPEIGTKEAILELKLLRINIQQLTSIAIL